MNQGARVPTFLWRYTLDKFHMFTCLIGACVQTLESPRQRLAC